MLRRWKIAPRLTLLILVGTGTILAAVSVSDYLGARRILQRELRDKAGYLALSTAREMEVIQRAIEKIVVQLAVVLETQRLGPGDVYPLLENTLKQHRELYGAAVALEPATGEAGVTIPYACREGDGIEHKDLAEGGYPYRTLDWYAVPMVTRAPVWTDPYYDEGGANAVMVTYSVPILDPQDGALRGVVTGDLSLEWLADLLRKMDLGQGGYAFLVSRTGMLVAHPRQDAVLRESVFSAADDAGNLEARRVGQSMIRGEAGFIEFTGLKQAGRFWLAYAPVPGTGWSLGAQFAKDAITSELADLSRMSVFLGGLGALAMVAVALWIARSISRPVRELDAAASRLAGGNLDASLPESRGGDEVAQLTRSFRRMQRDLKSYIEELRETTAAKTRIEADLQTARKIQLDLVPDRFEFDPPRPEVEVHAVLEPARAVGGDFYDFFLCPGERLFIAVGDVSGKGVPAALFMAQGKAFLRALIKETLDPARAVSRLNDELALENDEGMFLTVFCGLLDLRTGDLSYASGGHLPPLVLRASGTVEALPHAKGPLVGMDGDREFEPGRFRLERGDLLFSSSDGVTEAEDSSQELFGDDRTSAALARQRGLSPRAALEGLRSELGLFVGETPQSDDITMLAVRWLGGAEAAPPRAS